MRFLSFFYSAWVKIKMKELCNDGISEFFIDKVHGLI